MKIKLKPRVLTPKSKLGRRQKSILPVSKKPILSGWNIRCRECNAEAISYYTHAVWFYPDDFDGKREIWGYCTKHSDKVFYSCPIDVQMSFAKTGRTESHIDFDNRIIVGDTDVKSIGKIADHLMHLRGWPSVKDTNYDKMLDKDYEKLFLIYDGMTGRFKRSLTDYGKAVKSVDYNLKEVLVYYGKLEEEKSTALAIR